MFVISVYANCLDGPQECTRAQTRTHRHTHMAPKVARTHVHAHMYTRTCESAFPAAGNALLRARPHVPQGPQEDAGWFVAVRADIHGRGGAARACAACRALPALGACAVRFCACGCDCGWVVELPEPVQHVARFLPSVRVLYAFVRVGVIVGG